MAQPQQPGMFAQMATTAAGVAVGSAVVSIGCVLMCGWVVGWIYHSTAAKVRSIESLQQVADTLQEIHKLSFCQFFKHPQTFYSPPMLYLAMVGV